MHYRKQTRECILNNFILFFFQIYSPQTTCIISNKSAPIQKTERIETFFIVQIIHVIVIVRGIATAEHAQADMPHDLLPWGSCLPIVISLSMYPFTLPIGHEHQFLCLKFEILSANLTLLSGMLNPDEEV